MCYTVITLCVVFGVMVLYKRFVFQCCTEFGFCVKSSCYSEVP